MSDNTEDLIISISTDQATLRRSIKRIEQDLSGLAGSVKKQFDAASKGIDASMATTMQQRINAITGVGTKSAKEWTGALVDQGKELERLRAKYSPLFATINNYKTAVSDIKRAHAVGAISANEMAAAISKERQAALASTAAIKGRNAALASTPSVATVGSGSFNTANIAAQFQDIGVTAAMGMSPLQIALQQGTQLSAVFTELKREGQGVGTALASAFASVISPISLATIGTVALGAAAIQYFSSIMSSSDAAAEKLKEQASLIQAVADKWGDAVPALRDYANELNRAQNTANLKEGVALINENSLSGVKDQLGDLRMQFAALVMDLRDAGDEASVILALQKTFESFVASAEDGSLTVEKVNRVQEAMAAIVQGKGIPALEDFSKSFSGVSASALVVADSIQKVNRTVAKMQDATTWRSYNKETGRHDKFSQFADPWDDTIQRGANPGLITPEFGPVPQSRPPIELEGLPGAVKKEDTAADKLKQKYTDLITTARERNDELRLEFELIGKTGNATDAARNALELLQRAQRAGITGGRLEAIKQEADAYQELANKLGEARLQRDLMDQRRFSMLSRQDQQVTTLLRQYGLPDDLSSPQAAGIRQSLQEQETRSAIDQFSANLANGIVSSGGDIGKAFGQTFLAALQDSAQKQLTNVLSQLFNAMFRGGSGAGGVGAISGKVASGITGAAPVTPVTRSALPDVAGSTDIAAYIAKAATARGIDPDTALKVAKSEGGIRSWNLQSNYVKNGIREQSFGPFQLYKGGGLGNAFQRQTGLDPALAVNGPAGVDFALDHAAKNGWGAWYGAAKAGIGKWDGIGGSSAADAVIKLAESAGAATKGLNTFGGGLGQLGQSLAGAFPAAPSPAGGGGIGGWLSSIFGGGGGLSAAQITKYSGMVGLFAQGGVLHGPGTGTSDSIPIMASNEEFIVNATQSKKHRALLHAINSGQLGHMASGGLVSRGPVGVPVAPTLASRRGAANENRQPGVLHVTINGANGDDHVRMLVRQGVQAGLADQGEQMRRGGFGNMQATWSDNRG